MVIDLTKNNSTASIKNIDEDLALTYYSKLGLDHSSPSQEALSDSEFLVRYCLFTQEDRRLMNINYRMQGGVSVGRASQKFVSKYMYEAEKKILNEKKDLDTIIKEELEEYDKYQPHNELDKEQHQDTKNYIADMIKTTVAAVDKIKLEEESASERYCSFKFKDLVLPKIGRIDMEDRKSFIELKTKHRSKRKSDTKAGFSWVKGYLPKTSPDINHIRQCSFYWKASGKKPHLLYVNQDSYNIFDENNCELLTPEYMNFIIQQDLIKAKVRQNIIYLCKGSVSEMSRILPPPDFSGFMWKDIQDEYVRKAASLWDNV